ncbi:hypothetical protein Gbem_0328 [Citrifermentans bemidjiense Bem]|uniref:site-specific DNA-methyltransferase (cytosine-N(4)-specific) n=1 Tax=Citrifermentans bemidjiense (strain ATCC BAA-1014 / DSM 16622 / JCM 12645 / Bem) TaxID=404380 RepID=B5EAQ0_CITBB|nr:DNA methyltransferase [Citrifermentans bemidjiense]ACH37359.1 hypothetical protein Gbem_0328 [Citrifermentans bemidjiense Bem]
MSVLSLKRLDRINWDFPSAGTELGSVHSIHWFPGNYIPQIPAALIQVLSRTGEVVFDPFGGSGTTAIEALKLGRFAVVSDRISACVQITEAKLSLLGNPLDRDVCNKIFSSLTFEHLCQSTQIGVNGEGRAEDLECWYSSETLGQLRYIWKIIELQSSQVQKVLFALFSNVLFACASTNGSRTHTGKLRRHHWGWVADNVRPKELIFHNAIELFCKNLRAVMDTNRGPISTTAKVIQQDARNMELEDESVDLVVTSPPYAGVIDYTHANRLLYLWMGWPMGEERADEIGARYRRNRKNAVEEYLSDMRLCRDQIHRVLKKGSYCAIVVGESKKFPNTASLLIEDFSQSMPIVWGPKSRYLSRRRVSDRVAGDPVEFVCVFQKL